MVFVHSKPISCRFFTTIILKFFIFNIYIRNAGKTMCIKHELRDCKVSSIQWLFTVKVESQIFGFLNFTTEMILQIFKEKWFK